MRRLLQRAVAFLILIPCGVAKTNGFDAVPTPRNSSPIDLTGYWVSVVTQDWLYRNGFPPKGDVGAVPLNRRSWKIANAWEPKTNAAVTRPCNTYGAASVMRQPTRLHIAWQDEHTLRVDLDAGGQTRLVRFAKTGPPKSAGLSEALSAIKTKQTGARRTLQGDSMAAWMENGSLLVITRHMLRGFLTQNGVPYSDDAVLTEIFDSFTLRNGEKWLVLTSIVEDPQYLTEPFIANAQFKQEVDGSGWDYTPCDSRLGSGEHLGRTDY